MLSDFDLNFRGQIFKRWYLWNGEGLQKMRAITFIRYSQFLGICHQMGSPRMLSSASFTYIFKVKHLKYWYRENVERVHKNARCDFNRRLYSPSNGIIAHADRNLDLNFQGQNCLTLIYQKNSQKRWKPANAKLRGMTFVEGGG